MTVLTDLKARGVQDILIACTDNLKGLHKQLKRYSLRPSTQLALSIKLEIAVNL
ncbi:MAG: transposase [Bacteroidetes bacterium]|nr:transposase [Bacteroidota bacterium]